MSLTCLPLMPPAALISSTASVSPLCVDWPKVASEPVIEPYSPTTISFDSTGLSPPFLFGQAPRPSAAATMSSFRKRELLINRWLPPTNPLPGSQRHFIETLVIRSGRAPSRRLYDRAAGDRSAAAAPRPARGAPDGGERPGAARGAGVRRRRARRQVVQRLGVPRARPRGARARRRAGVYRAGRRVRSRERHPPARRQRVRSDHRRRVHLLGRSFFRRQGVPAREVRVRRLRQVRRARLRGAAAQHGGAQVSRGGGLVPD